MSDVLIIEPVGSDDYLDDEERKFNETFAEDSLEAQQPYLHLDGLLPNLTRSSGSAVRLKCHAAGSLPISFRWYKNDAPLLKEKNRITVKSRNHWSRLRMDNLHVLDSGYYRCEASNQAGKVQTTSVLKVQASTSRNRADAQSMSMISPDNDYPIQWVAGQLMSGTCQPYRGRACGHYLSGHKILVHSNDPEQLMDTERQLMAAISVIANVSSVSKACREYSEQVSCYHNYQMCDEEMPRGNSIGTPVLPLCKSDCLLLEEDICWEEYETAKAHNLIGPGALLPECHKLSDEVDKCLHVVKIAKSNQVNHSDPCYVGSGKSYRGTAALSESGVPCARWAHFSRLFPQYRSINYPELTGHNYCRNPGGKKPRPWCFTEDGKEEYCKLNKCPPDMYPELAQRELGIQPKAAGDSDSTPEGKFDFANFADYFQYIMVAAGVLGVLILAILAVLFIYCWRSRKARKDKERKIATYANGNICSSVSKNDLTHHQYELATLLPRSNAGFTNPISLTPEIPACNIRFVEMLGDVKFGSVWKGELFEYTGNGGEEEPTQIAVLALKEDALPNQRKEFEQELSRLSRLRHNNVVEIIGLCTSGHAPCMIFEYMVHGDLHEFLLLRAPYSQTGLLDKERILLDQSDFLHVVTQIASGMEYLSSQHFVHCDLATRNCLVTDRLTIKIANFGLIRPTYVTDYYYVQSKTLLPVRWMPPEAILYGRFAEASDVWAFGVTMWEMYTYGAQPYVGYSNQEVIEMVRQRCLLQCPDNCPTRMYSLMVECWHESPARRPQFQELHGRLQAWSVVSTPAHSSVVGSHGMGGNGGAPSLTHRSSSLHSGQSSSAGPTLQMDTVDAARICSNGNVNFASTLSACRMRMGPMMGSQKTVTSSPGAQKTMPTMNGCRYDGPGANLCMAAAVDSSVESTS